VTTPVPTTASPAERAVGPADEPVLRAGGRVLADAGRLLARHWPALLTVAVLAEVAHELALRAALLVAPWSGVAGLLVLSVAPLASVVGIVVMLHVLRRESGDGGFDLRALLGAIASVLVPYLVVYEFYGGLSSDWQAYVDAAALDHALAAGAGIETSSPVPEGFGPTVLLVVGGALALRTVLDRVARRVEARAGDGPRSGAAALRIASGYCEVVWIVVGAFTVAAATTSVREWWTTRAAVAAVGSWWQDVTAQVDLLRLLASAVGPVSSFVLAGVVTGLVVPLAWLTLGTIVYGVEAIDLVDPEHATTAAASPGRTERAVERFNRTLGATRARTAWRFMLDPGRRFGGLVGAVGMLWRSRWGAVLLFCVAFSVVTLAGQAVLAVGGAAVGQPGVVAWRAIVGPLDAAAGVVVTVLTTVLLAAAADALLATFGLPSALRVRRRSQPVAGTGSDQ